ATWVTAALPTCRDGRQNHVEGSEDVEGLGAGQMYFCLPSYPSPTARAIKNNPAPITTAPMARATRSLPGERRSAVMAAVTTAIARRSITPITRRIAVRPAEP